MKGLSQTTNTQASSVLPAFSDRSTRALENLPVNVSLILVF